ncbi:MAG: MFS transporter [Eubacteriales bacterium]|jgi:PPP family 3-phenylpropionic acid transporter|nr:MFS transporter [Eubacteriales bacterium]
MTIRKAFFTLCGVNFFIYGINAVYNCFIPLYLGGHFDEITVGGLLSIGPVVMMAAPLLWGVLSDKAKYKNNVLALIVCCAAVSFFMISLNDSLAYTAFTLALTMFFMSPYGGLVDNITLEATAQTGLRYGPIRLMGTVGYGVIAVVISVLPSSNPLFLFGSFVIISLTAALFLKICPQISGHAAKKEKADLRPLIRDKNMTLIIIIIFAVMFAFSYYSNFMPSYMTVELGLPAYIWGINVFVTLALEFPFFIWFDKIMKHFSLRRLLIVTAAVSALRYLLLGLVTHPALILAVGALTGAWVTVAIYCGTYYISATVPDNIRASGQSYMYAVGYGTPKVLAGIGGGIMTRYLGVPTSYFLCAALCAACLIAAFMFPREYA